MRIDIQELFKDIKKKMAREGAWTEEQYYDTIDETLDEKRRWGELPDDFDFETMRANLRMKWEEIKR